MIGNSSDMPLPPSMSRAARAISSDLPQELRLIIDIVSGANFPSSLSHVARMTLYKARPISVCMSAINEFDELLSIPNDSSMSIVVEFSGSIT